MGQVSQAGGHQSRSRTLGRTGSTLLSYLLEGSHGTNVEPNGYELESLEKAKMLVTKV